jgi:hypothetical protein
MPMQLLQRLVVTVAIVSSATGIVLGDERTAAEVLPPSTVIFAEIRQPEKLLTTVYDHPLARRIEALDQVRSAMEKKEYLDFKAGVSLVELQSGLPWRKIVSQATGGGVSFAMDAKTRGVVILARATDKTIQSKLIEILTNLAKLDAKNKGNPEPITTSEYRGIKAYAIEKSNFTVVQDWLVVTNNDELGKQIVDRLLDGPKESLAADVHFTKAHGAVSASTTVWVYVNAAAIRDAGLAKALFGGKAENPLIEFLGGGILSTLRQTPYITAGLELSDRQLRLFATAPHDHTWAGESREYYFGPEGKGVAPSRFSVDNTVVSLSGYRDVSAMWLRAGDLFNEQMNEELAKAESGLSTLFSGKDFGEDILGAFRPQGQIVVVRQLFAEGQPAPAIKLPAFALVAELKDPARMQPELRRTFQSLIGFLNVVGAMNGQPQLDLDMEKSDAMQLVTASYLADPNAKDPAGLKIYYNFSPSIAFAGKRFVVASTKGLAKALATANAADRPSPDAAQIVNTDAVLHFDGLREILADNRGQLVAQNILSQGHTKEEAEKAIGALLELVSWFDHLAFSLATTPSELRLSLDVGIKATN